MTAPTEAEEREAREAADKHEAYLWTERGISRVSAAFGGIGFEAGYLAALAKSAEREKLWREWRQLCATPPVNWERIKEIVAALGITGEGERPA